MTGQRASHSALHLLEHITVPVLFCGFFGPESREILKTLGRIKGQGRKEKGERRPERLMLWHYGLSDVIV